MKKVYLKYEDNKLQVFFAVLAYVEKFKTKRIFLFDKNNLGILTECEAYCRFEKLDKSNIKSDFETVEISINHQLPSTEIRNIFSAPLLFPRFLKDTYYTHIRYKRNEIYFRGLYTRRRAIEFIKFFLTLKDIKALRIMLTNIIKFKYDFKIETDHVYIFFTKRGRQAKYKYLDEEYYSEMANYKYVFCPPGDFTWTYRFFEAIQVGSIPITKHTIPEYMIFNYLKQKNHDSTISEEQMIQQNIMALENKYYL